MNALSITQAIKTICFFYRRIIPPILLAKPLEFLYYKFPFSFNFATEGHSMSKNIIGNLMKQAQQMQERVKKLQEEAAGKTVEASSGGGMVTVVANGRQEILSIKIDPSVVDPKDIEMLQDLVTAAVNEALRKSQELMKEEMARLTAGMGLPPGLI
jgi:DNA-binding YbaB/EbfC family protein